MGDQRLVEGGHLTVTYGRNVGFYCGGVQGDLWANQLAPVAKNTPANEGDVGLIPG